VGGGRPESAGERRRQRGRHEEPLPPHADRR
jgi:hypothetical protein